MSATRRIYQAPKVGGLNEGSALLHAEPERVVAELESFHAATAADIALRDHFVDFVRHTPGFTSAANYKFGHITVVAGVVSPRRDALGMFRDKRGEWHYPQGHLARGDESLQAAAVRITSTQLGLTPDEFAPLLDAPVCLAVLPGQNNRGESCHYHNVVGFSFRATMPGLYAPSVQTYADWKNKPDIEPALGDRAAMQRMLTRVFTSVLAS